VAVVALVVSVLSMIRSCKVDHDAHKYRAEMDIARYMEEAGTRQPRMLPGTFCAHSVTAEVDSATPEGDTVRLCMSQVRVCGVLPMVNRSPWPARPLALVSCDWPTPGTKLRDVLLDPRQMPAFSVDTAFDFMGTLCEGETTRLDIDRTARFVDAAGRGKILFHFLLLYENAEGKLYDSYVLIGFAPIDRPVPTLAPRQPTRAVRDSLLRKAIGSRVRLPPNSVLVTKPMDDLKAYTQKEAELMRARLRTAREDAARRRTPSRL